MKHYKNGRMAALDVGNGRVLAPGEPILKSDLPVDDKGRFMPETQALIDDGALIDAIVEDDREPTKAELQQRAADLDIEGRSKMNVEQLTEAIEAAEKALAESAGEDETTTGGDPV